MSGKHWTYPTAEDAYKALDALSHADGLPRKGHRVNPTNTGKQIPETYSEGAHGWTEDLVSIHERDGGGPPDEAFSVDQVPELTDQYDEIDVNHPVHGAIKTPAKKAAKKKGAWKGKRKRPARPKKGGGKKGTAKTAAAAAGGPGIKMAATVTTTKKKVAKKGAGKKLSRRNKP